MTYRMPELDSTCLVYTLSEPHASPKVIFLLYLMELLFSFPTSLLPAEQGTRAEHIHNNVHAKGALSSITALQNYRCCATEKLMMTVSEV